MQLSAYAPLIITNSGHFAAAVRHMVIHPSNENTRLVKFVLREGTETWQTMGPYGAASADRAINITLHRREIDLLKVSDCEGGRTTDVIRHVLNEERP